MTPPAASVEHELRAALEKVHALLMAMPGDDGTSKGRNIWRLWTDACNIAKSALSRPSSGEPVGELRTLTPEGIMRWSKESEASLAATPGKIKGPSDDWAMLAAKRLNVYGVADEHVAAVIRSYAPKAEPAPVGVGRLVKAEELEAALQREQTYRRMWEAAEARLSVAELAKVGEQKPGNTERE